MFNFINKNKFIIVAVLIDLFLFWLLFYSGYVLPFINPSLEQYNASNTSFPRNYNQTLIWYLLHAPTSIVIGAVSNGSRLGDLLAACSVAQTGVLVHFIEKAVRSRKTIKAKA